MEFSKPCFRERFVDYFLEEVFRVGCAKIMMIIVMSR